MKEIWLVLRDRGLVVGDVVKRQPSDPESGSVIRTAATCTIRPVYSDLPYHGTEPWPHRASENEVAVPEEELQFQDFQVGDHVIYKEWIGEVMDVFEEVTVRLGNGSVVRVHNAEELEVREISTEFFANTKRQRLLFFLRQMRKYVDDMGSDEPTVPADYYYPGQRVSTKKGNLRLGTWIIGSYSPSVAPKGVVVEVRVFQISVHWIANNLSDNERISRPEPWESIDGDQLNEVKLYSRNSIAPLGGLSTIAAGSSQGPSMAVGDFVKFRDISGAAAKYSSDAPERDRTGVFRRIPRTITQGFEMNMFWIRSTSTQVWVQWQDGTTTEENSTSLLPYLNVDDHDLWVGEICSLKRQEVREDGVIVLKEVGVVQAVNARERTAWIRWFQDPQVRIFQDRESVLVPGSILGPLSDRESSVSVYEVVAYSALTKRRGDLVLIFPNAAAAGRSTQGLPDLLPSELSRLFGFIQNAVSSRSQPSDDPQNIGSRGEIRWFGEIVDLGLDGLLTVRLGAMSHVEDIRVPVERVLTVVGGDDPDFYSEAEEADNDYDSEDEYDTDEEQAIEERIEYEGGARLDNDEDDDAWMTDGEGEDDTGEPEPEIPDHNEDTWNGPSKPQRPDAQDSQPLRLNGVSEPPHSKSANGTTPTPSTTPPRSVLETHEEYNFSAYPDMPPQFEILDESEPADHFFRGSASRLPAALLRRIRKEHAMLSNALPPGIWVRTWADRLDLLRILIVGPRGTPYELAPFVLDIHLPDAYPTKPPEVHFHSWTFGVGRINPNLYEEGTVCLSILGTWPEGEKHEAWNPAKSSVLQVVVSLLGLVLVAEPYYSMFPPAFRSLCAHSMLTSVADEAGFESLFGTEETQVPSRIYTEKAYCMAKGFVAQCVQHSVRSLENVIHWVYLDPHGPQFLRLVVDESKGLIGEQGMGGRQTKVLDKLSAGAEMLLRPHFKHLEARLAQLESK